MTESDGLFSLDKDECGTLDFSRLVLLQLIQAASDCRSSQQLSVMQI